MEKIIDRITNTDADFRRRMRNDEAQEIKCLKVLVIVQAMLITVIGLG